MQQPVTDFIKNNRVDYTHQVNRTAARHFSAVRISKSDNLIFPDRLTIDDDKVVFYKGKLIGYDTTTILRENIGGVSIDADILFADIRIETSGGQRIVAEGFTKGDAKTIQKLLSR